jgi:hypothetical protein
VRLFYKSFYRRSDFDDERYSPTFAPTARPGQKVRIGFRMERWEGEKLGVCGYARETDSGRIIETTATLFPAPGERQLLEFAVPEVGGSQVDEIGLVVTGYSGSAKRDSGRLLVDLFEVSGPARYAIDIARQSIEFGCVTPFSHDRGRWTIEGGRMHLMTHEDCASYTGGHSVEDQRVSASVRPLAGTSHLLAVRAAGATRGYFAGFDGPDRVSVIKKDSGFERLASAPFAWEAGRDYRLEVSAIGERIALKIDGREIVAATDGAHRAGMVGCGAAEGGRALYGPFEVEELS